MKRISLFVVISIILMALTAFAAEDDVEDYTPEDWPEYIPSDGSDPIDIGVLGQIQSTVSQLSTKVDNVQKECARSFKASDVSQLKQEIDFLIDKNLGDILGKMLALLLIWQIFFFATLFLAKAKGWI